MNLTLETIFIFVAIALLALVFFSQISSAFGQFQVNPEDSIPYNATQQAINQEIERERYYRQYCTPQIRPIISESMEPILKVGENVLVDYCANFFAVEIGDIIVFEASNDHKMPAVREEVAQRVMQAGLPPIDPNDRLIMHRVIDIDTMPDGSTVLTTKGDNNDNVMDDVEDNITFQDFKGVVIKKLPTANDEDDNNDNDNDNDNDNNNSDNDNDNDDNEDED